jgi:hypothetical protein
LIDLDAFVQDMVNNIIKHRTTLQQHGKSNLGAEPVMASTWELVRLMKVLLYGKMAYGIIVENYSQSFQKSPSTQRLQRLHTDRSEGMLQVLGYMTKVSGAEHIP